jgi:hypothetical protein
MPDMDRVDRWPVDVLAAHDRFRHRQFVVLGEDENDPSFIQLQLRCTCSWVHPLGIDASLDLLNTLSDKHVAMVIRSLRAGDAGD